MHAICMCQVDLVSKKIRKPKDTARVVNSAECLSSSQESPGMTPGTVTLYKVGVGLHACNLNRRIRSPKPLSATQGLSGQANPH